MTWVAVLLAETPWPEAIKQGGLVAVILALIYGFKLLVSGVLRLDREVKAERDGRLAAEERADKEAAARQKIQDAVMNDWTPAVIEARLTGKQLVDAHIEAVEMQKKLVDAFLSWMSRNR
jgi:hypothetical protein